MFITLLRGAGPLKLARLSFEKPSLTIIFLSEACLPFHFEITLFHGSEMFFPPLHATPPGHRVSQPAHEETHSYSLSLSWPYFGFIFYTCSFFQSHSSPVI